MLLLSKIESENGEGAFFFVGCDIVCFLPSSTREPENVAKMNTSFSIVRFSCSKPALSS